MHCKIKSLKAHDRRSNNTYIDNLLKSNQVNLNGLEIAYLLKSTNANGVGIGLEHLDRIDLLNDFNFFLLFLEDKRNSGISNYKVSTIMKEFLVNTSLKIANSISSKREGGWSMIVSNGIRSDILVNRYYYKINGDLMDNIFVEKESELGLRVRDMLSNSEQNFSAIYHIIKLKYKNESAFEYIA